MCAALRAIVLLVFSIVLLPVAARAQANPDGQPVGFELAWNHVALTPTEDFAFIGDNAGNAIELIAHKTP